MNYLEEVYRQTADGGYFDFARCQRADGSFYGTGGTCRIGDKVGAREADPSKKAGKVKLGGVKVGTDKALMALTTSQLKQLREDPRLYDYQKVKIDAVIAKKGGEAAPSAKPSAKPAPSAKPEPKPAAKKEAQTPEQKAEEKWLKQEAKFKVIEAEQKRIKAEIEATGLKVYATGPGADEMRRRLKEAGLPSITQSNAMAMKLREGMPERLKAERREEKIRQVKEELANTPKEQRKALIDAALKKNEAKYQLTNEAHLKQVESNLEMMKSFMLSDPTLNNLENRTAYAGLRALHMKMLAATREQRAGEIAAAKARTEEMLKAVQEGPKRNSTPGSTAPVKSAADLGPKVAEYLEKKQKRDELKKQLDELEKLPWEERKAKGYQKIDDEHSLLNGEMIRLERSRDFMQLGDIYKAQGFNDKPVLVATRADLESRDDILKQPGTNKPIIMYRGVTTPEFTDQFKGLGKDGDTHYPGEGIYGNGTYAAATAPGARSSLAEQIPQGTARSYAGSGGKVDQRVTAFAFRNDANVKDFGEGSMDERFNRFSDWRLEVLKGARDKYGVEFNDVGHAAAALGYHAYRVPMSDQGEDYFVILNRGALITALDPQLINP